MYHHAKNYKFTCCIVVLIHLFAASFVSNGLNQHDENSCSSATFPQSISGEVPKDVARKFKRDAARLALRLAAGNEDPRYLNAYIPSDYIDLIYNALSTVYLAEERGKSLERCNVHTYPSPSIDYLVIIYDKNIPWARPLAQGQIETDSRTFNALMDQYNLVIEKHVNWTDSQDAITLRSKTPLNMAAIANEFNNIEGVAEIDLGIPKVVGNDINARRVANGWEIDYILRFGSWASGKGKSHTWKYRVSDGGKVTFLSETGEPIPDWLKCGRETPLVVGRF